MSERRDAGAQYRRLYPGDITRALFAHFDRRQQVTRCWRKVDGQWVVRDIAFTDDWSAADYDRLLGDLVRTAGEGGYVCGAFVDGQLKGFCAVDAARKGSQGQYADLESLHVSSDMRGRGMGRALFERALAFGREIGARKLYISAHSSVESQAFYRAMGCVEAGEYNAEHVQAEPCDCQMEVEVG